VLIALGAGALAAPFRSFAQQAGKVWRIGFLATRHVDFVDTDPYYGPFRRGMREHGYVEGKNLVIEWRSAEENIERLPGLAAEMVNLKVDVIVTGGASAIRALQQATKTIPIVFLSTGDPVANGFAASLARPGGNITGMSNLSGDLDAKRLELLIATAPKAKRVAEIVNPANASSMKRIPILEAVVRRAGREFIVIHTQSVQEFAAAFAMMRRQGVGALMVSGDLLFLSHVPRLAELAFMNKMPSLFGVREGAEAGGLMSYGTDRVNTFRYATIYVDKILKGANPGDLPIEQPNKFELAINLKTAKSLGIKIPDTILARADKVIE
jgi:putative ABC transport system substrate-binding protein